MNTKIQEEIEGTGFNSPHLGTHRHLLSYHLVDKSGGGMAGFSGHVGRGVWLAGQLELMNPVPFFGGGAGGGFHAAKDHFTGGVLDPFNQVNLAMSGPSYWYGKFSAFWQRLSVWSSAWWACLQPSST